MDRTQVLQNRIMRRVYGIWLFRKVRYSSFTKLLMVGALALIASPAVSFEHVLANIARSLTSFQNFQHYFLDATLKPELIVKIALTGAGVIALLFVIDFARSLGQYLSKSIQEKRMIHRRQNS